MPIQDCQSNDKQGFSWGPEGTCYLYNPNHKGSITRARKKARRQGIAIEVSKGLTKLSFAKQKISFDYDQTLSTEAGKKKAEAAIKAGNDVYIITARQESGDNKDLYSTAEKLGISKYHIHFTNGKDKWEEVERLGIDIHYDNNQEQIDKIKKNTKASGILI